MPVWWKTCSGFPGNVAETRNVGAAGLYRGWARDCRAVISSALCHPAGPRSGTLRCGKPPVQARVKSTEAVPPRLRRDKFSSRLLDRKILHRRGKLTAFSARLLSSARRSPGRLELVWRRGTRPKRDRAGDDQLAYTIALVQNQSGMAHYSYADGRLILAGLGYGNRLFTACDIDRRISQLDDFDAIFLGSLAVNDKAIRDAPGPLNRGGTLG
jgi:hypothetical protein